MWISALGHVDDTEQRTVCRMLWAYMSAQQLAYQMPPVPVVIMSPRTDHLPSLLRLHCHHIHHAMLPSKCGARFRSSWRCQKGGIFFHPFFVPSAPKIPPTSIRKVYDVLAQQYLYSYIRVLHWLWASCKRVGIELGAYRGERGHLSRMYFPYPPVLADNGGGIQKCSTPF